MLLSKLFVLEQVHGDMRSGTGVEVHRLAASEFFTAVLPHAYCFSLSSLARKRRMMRHYLEFGSRLRTFRVRFEADLARLPSVLDQVEDVLRHP